MRVPKKKINKAKKKAQGRIKPIMAILCDDVRKEEGGKPFILGIYVGGVKVYPQEDQAIMQLIMSLWVPFQVLEVGNTGLEFRILGPNEDNKIEIKAHLELSAIPPAHEINAITLKGFPLQFSKDGNIQIQYRHEGDEAWETLRSVPVEIKPSNVK